MTASGNVVAGGFTGAGVSTTLNGTVVKRDASGNFTAGTITGNLTGDVTGDCSGNSGTTSDGTSANQANKIVRRDANGNFAAGTITGNLTGDVTGGCSGNSGTTSDGTSANQANKIVRRNASGDISIQNLSANYAEFNASSTVAYNIASSQGAGSNHIVAHNKINQFGESRPRTGDTTAPGNYTIVGVADLATDLCAKFHQEVVFKSSIYVESDMRIKEEITTIDQKHSLDVIEKLRPVSYKLMKNGALALGYIGQEISDIISPAVSKSIEPIGNIRIHGVVTKNKSITDNEGRECVSLVIELEKSLQEEIKNKKDIFFGVGIQLMDGRNRNLYYDPELCDDPTDMSIELLDYTKDKQLDKDTRIVVFGEIVTDFCIIDYDKVFVVVSSAVKELNDIRKEDRSRIETLENQVSQLLARVEALESK